MLFIIAQTFCYALWQTFVYSMFTLALARLGVIKSQRRLRALAWLLAINACGTITFGAVPWQKASLPVAAGFTVLALAFFLGCHLWLGLKRYRKSRRK